MMSMTGFGRSSFTIDTQTYRLELRSVNHRFLDIKIRLPWVNGELETYIVEQVRKHVSRGRVELTILVEPSIATDSTLKLNISLAHDAARLLHQLADILHADLTTAAHLVPPIDNLLVTNIEPKHSDMTWNIVEPSLLTALSGLLDMRRREGVALAQDIERQLNAIEQRSREINKLAAGEPERQRIRLQNRLEQVQQEGLPLDSRRLIEEIAIYADRSDINEELTRLSSHIEQLRQMLAQKGEVGRKMEFMLQELHRELNTMASKTMSAQIAQLVVDAKAAAERIREQVQNIE